METDIDRAISGHEARNAELRRLFQEKGIDLGEARLIECPFWAWKAEHASSLAEDLVRRGFRILAQDSAASKQDPPLWNIEAEIKQSIELTLRPEFTDALVRVAASHHGVYDGWGTSI